MGKRFIPERRPFPVLIIIQKGFLLNRGRGGVARIEGRARGAVNIFDMLAADGVDDLIRELMLPFDVKRHDIGHGISVITLIIKDEVSLLFR